MPTWAKYVVAVIAVGGVVLAAAGFIATRALVRAAADFQDAMIADAEDGTAFGRTGTLDDCVGQAAGRLATCEDSPLTCGPRSTSFLWACFDTAPYDESFCRGVPSADNDTAVTAWGERICRENGNLHEVCPAALSVTAGYCEYQAGQR